MRPEEGEMKRTRILIATDGSDFGTAAVDAACSMIDPATTSVRVISAYAEALPVAVDPAFISEKYYEEVEAGNRELAKQIVARAEDRIRRRVGAPSIDIKKMVVRGDADHEIVEAARRWKADLVVIGSHGRGFWGRLLGSVSDGVVHHAPCSVLVVKTTDVRQLGLAPMTHVRARRKGRENVRA